LARKSHYRLALGISFKDEERGRGGERGGIRFQPKREAVLGFVLYFFLFSLGTALGREEEKRVFQRSRTYPAGRIRYHLSGILLFGLLSLEFFLVLEGRTILGIEKE